MILGFALVYRCLADLRPQYVPVIFKTAANLDDFHRALAFTMRNFQLTAAGDTDNLLFGFVVLEGLCAILISVSFGAIQFKRN